MKSFLLIFGFFFFCGEAASQNVISPQQFLRGAYQEESVVYHNKRLQFFNTHSYALPFIDKLEVRTETNEFDWRKQEYLVRVSPNNKKKRYTQQQHQETVRYLSEMETEAALGQALRGRYDLIVNHHFLVKILDAKKKQQILFKDKVILLRRSTALPDFDVLDLIEAEDAEQENIRDMLDLENTILNLEQRIQIRNENETLVAIDDEDFMDVANFKKILAEIPPNPNPNHSELKVLAAKTYNKMLEYEWEAANYKFSLSYIQGKFGFDERETFQKNVSIGIGFDIPLKAAGRLDLNELQIEIIEAENQYYHAKTELSETQFALYQNLENLLKKYDLVLEQLEGSQAEFALKEYRKITEVPPKALLKLRENTLRKELLLQNLEWQIMKAYVEYLDFSGLLSKQPLKNYLTGGMESLEKK